MTLAYRDALGIVEVRVDADGVAFVDGYAYFMDEDGNGYKVAMTALISVY